MNSDWVTSVDMLADAGIVNFDAAAYVTGAPPVLSEVRNIRFIIFRRLQCLFKRTAINRLTPQS